MTGIQNINLANFQAMMFTAQAFSNVSMDTSIFGSLTMPSMQAPAFNFSNLLSNFNFNFSGMNFGSAFQSTPVQSGSQSAKRGAKGLDANFLARVKQIAQRVGCDYKDLLGIMHSESGLDSTATNRHGGATGLIQFMPATARTLGTTTDALRNMSALQQLDYVEKFLIKQKNASTLKNKQKLSGGDLYSLVFLPARSGREVLTASGENYYSANKGLDTNHDGQITKSELSARVAKHHVNESIFAGSTHRTA